jgi:hypothetical protein
VRFDIGEGSVKIEEKAKFPEKTGGSDNRSATLVSSLMVNGERSHTITFHYH